MQVPHKTTYSLVWLSYFLVLGYSAFTFANLDQLTSFADDGGSYLIMAQYFSPYSDVLPLIDKAYINERYPPFFPMLLAITGNAEDIADAHQLVVLLFLIACVMYAVWATRILGSQWIGLLVSLIYVSSPFVWPMLLRIVSEELYMVLAFGVLLTAGRASKEGGWWLVLLALLLTLVMLTRTIGIALVVAWGVHLFFNRSRFNSPALVSKLLSLVLPVMTVVAWHVLRRASEVDLYNSELIWLIDRVAESSHPLMVILQYLIDQSGAMLDSWLGALMLYWQPDFNPRYILALALAVMAITGWLIRLRKNCLDAWYSLFYVGIILVWPFPGQFFRFIVPMMPLFIVYAVQVTQIIGGRYQNRLAMFAPAMTGFAFLALSTPATLLIYQRSQFSAENELDFSSNPEFYQEADLRLASNKATQHLLLARDMELIKARTSSDATIMWFTPGYLNLLADREGVEFPDVAGRSAMLAAIAEDSPDYIYISRLHPRRTSENGLEILAWAGEAGVAEWSTLVPGTNDVFSVMLRVDD